MDTFSRPWRRVLEQLQAVPGGLGAVSPENRIAFLEVLRVHTWQQAQARFFKLSVDLNGLALTEELALPLADLLSSAQAYMSAVERGEPFLDRVLLSAELDTKATGIWALLEKIESESRESVTEKILKPLADLIQEAHTLPLWTEETSAPPQSSV